MLRTVATEFGFCPRKIRDSGLRDTSDNLRSEAAIKIVLDITRLVTEGKLTPDQARELTALAARDTGSLAISALMAFGAIAVAVGVLALQPTFPTGAAIGAAFLSFGLYLVCRTPERWRLLGTANTVIGALLLSGGVIGLVDGRLPGFLFAVALFLASAVAIRSHLLMALAPLALAAALGSSTGYFHASYMLIVREPTVTIVVFALLGWVAYFLSRRVGARFEELTLTFARVSVILINFGFWVGSLWGDYAGESWAHSEVYSGAGSSQALKAWRAHALHVPEGGFIVLWAIGILAVGIWGARANRRWVVNTAVAFGAIHFYTQWFERLGAAPWTIILAGLTVVAIAVALWRYNARPDDRSGAAGPGRVANGLG